MTIGSVTPFQQALEGHHRAYGSFIKTCSRLTPKMQHQPGVCGDWTPAEVAAHLAGWQHEAARRFRQILEDPGSRVSYQTNDFNARSVQERSGWDWDEIIRDLKASYLSMENAITALVVANPPDWQPFTEWLTGLQRDFEEHAAQLETCLGG